MDVRDLESFSLCSIGYADNEWVIHHSTDLYKQLADSEETDSILPLQIPFLKSYDYKYATTSEGRPIHIGMETLET